MPALSSVKKERVGLGGSRMGTKENKRENGVHGSATKKNLDILLFKNIFSSNSD
jgi:hypothetical protein